MSKKSSPQEYKYVIITLRSFREKRGTPLSKFQWRSFGQILQHFKLKTKFLILIFQQTRLKIIPNFVGIKFLLSGMDGLLVKANKASQTQSMSKLFITIISLKIILYIYSVSQYCISVFIIILLFPSSEDYSQTVGQGNITLTNIACRLGDSSIPKFHITLGNQVFHLYRRNKFQLYKVYF